MCEPAYRAATVRERLRQAVAPPTGICRCAGKRRMGEMWGRLQPSPEGTPGFSPPFPHGRLVRSASQFQYLEHGRTEVRRRLKPAPPMQAKKAAHG